MFNPNSIQKINELINEAIHQRIIPGASYALVSKQEIYVESIGYLQLYPEKVKLPEHPIYDLASVTKVLATTSAILKLIQEGDLYLDLPVCKILPRFKYPQITIRHLVSHTSGLPSLKRFYQTAKDMNEFWDSVYALELEYETGTKVVYSDFGFVLLGEIVKTIRGSLEDVTDEIFKALEMKTTCYKPDEHLKSRCAVTENKPQRSWIQGSVHDGNAYFMNGISGHAGLFSTASDCAKYVQMVLQEGQFNGKQVFHPQVIKLLRTPLTKETMEVQRSVGWILNSQFDICNLASPTAIYHTGFTGTSILIDQEIGFVLLTNKVHCSRDSEAISALRSRLQNLAMTSWI